MRAFIKAGAVGVMFVGILAFNLVVLGAAVWVVVWVLRAVGVLPAA